MTINELSDCLGMNGSVSIARVLSLQRRQDGDSKKEEQFGIDKNYLVHYDA